MIKIILNLIYLNKKKDIQLKIIKKEILMNLILMIQLQCLIILIKIYNSNQKMILILKYKKNHLHLISKKDYFKIKKKNKLMIMISLILTKKISQKKKYLKKNMYLKKLLMIVQIQKNNKVKFNMKKILKILMMFFLKEKLLFKIKIEILIFN